MPSKNLNMKIQFSFVALTIVSIVSFLFESRQNRISANGISFYRLCRTALTWNIYTARLIFITFLAIIYNLFFLVFVTTTMNVEKTKFWNKKEQIYWTQYHLFAKYLVLGALLKLQFKLKSASWNLKKTYGKNLKARKSWILTPENYQSRESYSYAAVRGHFNAT